MTSNPCEKTHSGQFRVNAKTDATQILQSQRFLREGVYHAIGAEGRRD
ncbi:hypothetical protein COLINT_02446 [Collinsella intestinalis DSM 13280]|uniref:Uncharacterized protein n=1 Tax=Collinsella intestinalis DSM 13280 TaxID=521003 RepID=C4F8S2_9ACTN|nr:hypothetical protein COLINT_02446 [Collinsella intestinalis DSM 13280]